MTPREAISRALWLKEAMHRHAENWPSTFAWHEEQVAAGRMQMVADSAVGSCVARAERVLRLLEAAGVEARMREG